MYRDNYIKALRSELLEIVADELTPIAIRYNYSEVPLEGNIKWRPQVLLLGNYSSGKSTLINDFLGAKVQNTGQAPTDDSFTVITYDHSQPPEAPIQVSETRDGKFLLSNPEYPFETLKKHGQRFASHFRYKKVNSPFLKNLAIIDTPGMLDSISERDRGYDYQEVIGDLAQIADLVLVLFDPHKAGTVREAHTSLRDTLPARTFEDRVLFVLNRIDECSSLIDLLRVYGTLCWNLSQITGRKDIPMIHLTYSKQEALKSNNLQDSNYLKFLQNQRDDLKKAVLKAPCFRLDNLATFIETHAERIAHMLEALISFRKRARKFSFKSFGIALLASLGAAATAFLLSIIAPTFSGMPLLQRAIAAVAIGLTSMIFWSFYFRKTFYNRFYRKTLKQIDNLTTLENQTRRDCWETIRNTVLLFLSNSNGKYPIGDLRHDYRKVWKVYEKGSKEIREALSELNEISPEDEEEFFKNRLELNGFKEDDSLHVQSVQDFV
ncbi:MAG: Dynamin family protein [Desulfobacteraceae bacterium]|nr:Dynamin family protein [Desulfobacteraceae bacterium]